MTDKQELRRLAHEASETEAEMDWLDRDWLSGIMADDWADYVAALKPNVLIGLLDQLEALHAVLGEPDEIKAEPASDYAALRKQFMSLLMLANSKCKQTKHWRAQSGQAMHQTLLSTAANVNAERDTNAILTDALEQAESERDQLRGELEACKAALSAIAKEVDGNIRPTVRDIINGRPDGNDLYGYCDTIDGIISKAVDGKDG